MLLVLVPPTSSPLTYKMASEREVQEKARRDRKTRRTHKNSRDGCPNCRAKRIKCTEELPSCSNCIKKGYRCGYLDFSPERIEHIRRKNILKQQEEEQIERLKRKHEEERKAKVKKDEQDSKPLSHYLANNTSDPHHAPADHHPIKHQPIQQHYQLAADLLVDGPGIVPNIPAASILDLPAVTPQDPIHRRPLRKSGKSFDRRIDYPNHNGRLPSPDADKLRSLIYSTAFGDVTDEAGYLDHLATGTRPWDILNKYPEQDLLYQAPGGTAFPPHTVDSSLLMDPSITPMPAHAAQMSHPYQPNHHFQHIATPAHHPQSHHGNPPPLHEDPHHHASFPPSQHHQYSQIASDPYNASYALPNARGPPNEPRVTSNLVHDHDPTMKLENMDLNATYPRINSEGPSPHPHPHLQPQPPLPRTKVFDLLSHDQPIENVLSHATPGKDELDSKTGEPLPNASRKPRAFKLLVVPEHLQNNLLKKSIHLLTSGQITLQEVRNFQFEETVQPVWDPFTFKKFRISLFNQAVMFNLYFSFFIEEAVCILLRTVQSKVSPDTGTLVLSSGTDSAVSSPMSVVMESFPLGSMYTAETLDRLERMHYITFGNLLQDLRGSINSYHHEYAIKMSFMVAITGFMKRNADISTLFMMLSGAMVLTKTLLSEAKLIREVGLGIRQELMMINSLVSTALQPDYLFDVINNLDKSLFVYREIVNDISYNVDNGLVQYHQSVIDTVHDSAFCRDMNELSLFLTRLQDELYPQLKRANSFFIGQGSDTFSSANIHFVSPTLIFNLVYEWLRIYPGAKVSMKSKDNPLKKMLYLFYHALGRCLSQVITPIKWITLIDPSDILAFPVGFEVGELQQDSLPQFTTITNIYFGLVKTIKFFEYRQTILGYHTSRSLTSNYIKRESQEPPADCDYRDIVRLDLHKMKVEEEQVSNTMTEVVGRENIPFFEDMYADVELMDIIKIEEERQIKARESERLQFDFHTGLLNHDFNPTLMIEHFTRNKQNIMYDITPSLEPLRQWCDGYLNDRMESSDAAQRIGDEMD